MAEEKKVLGYKGTGIWQENGFARTRKKPGIIDEPDEDKARELMKEYMNEYADSQNKELNLLSIELYPVYEGDI